MIRKYFLLGSRYLFIVFLFVVNFACPPKNEPLNYDYTMRTNPVFSVSINALNGGVIEVPVGENIIPGVSVEIPSNCLSGNSLVTVSEVDNPPFLPQGLNFVGNPFQISSDNEMIDCSLNIEFPYFDQQINDAGLSTDVALRLYLYDGLQWKEQYVISTDTVNNVVYGQVESFGIVAIVGLSGLPAVVKSGAEEDAQPGDLLFKYSHGGWYPGHVGVYVGEKIDENGNKYNVVEALGEGVMRNYYEPLSNFSGSDTFLGVREPSTGSLTPSQRQTIVNFVEEQVGLPYAWEQTRGVLWGSLEGENVKGPDSFNCVGLAEAAYELAGVNGGEGLVSSTDEGQNCGTIFNHQTCVPGALTPAEQFAATRPAGSTEEEQGPIIEWASLTPANGTPCTMVLLRVSVTHIEGLDFIDRVTYVTDSGYTNPNIYINDEGIDGDEVANDGIYSVEAYAGGDAATGYFLINLTVTDKSSRMAEIVLRYTFTGSCFFKDSSSYSFAP